jgi:sugar transferase (PEP-CTERM/EpsH1 system associated)
MKIMHVLLSLEYGGAEKVAVNLIKKMQKDGFEFSVCVLDKSGGLRDELNGNIQVECAHRKGMDLTLPFRLTKVIKEFSPDIIHMHNSTPFLYGVIAARLAGIKKIVVTQHGSITKESKKMQFMLKRISGMINKTVAVSKDIEKYIKDTYKINGNKLELIINGIDEEIYKKDEGKRKEDRKKLGLEDKFVIGHVARLSPEKDQNTLIEAFSKVAKEIDKARLVIVGDGPLKDSLRLNVKSLKLQDKVLFSGSRSDVQDIMKIFDVFVLSSVREGTPLTLLEAMATELPIVATNVGGNPDVVRNGENGLLVSPGNPDMLAEKIVYLYKNPELRDKMGKAGRKRVIEEFGLSKMAERYMKIYREL